MLPRCGSVRRVQEAFVHPASGSPAALPRCGPLFRGADGLWYHGDPVDHDFVVQPGRTPSDVTCKVAIWNCRYVGNLQPGTQRHHCTGHTDVGGSGSGRSHFPPVGVEVVEAGDGGLAGGDPVDDGADFGGSGASGSGRVASGPGDGTGGGRPVVHGGGVLGFLEEDDGGPPDGPPPAPPPPTPPSGWLPLSDYWEARVGKDAWVRHHLTRRRALFVPSGGDGPDSETLDACRVTYVTFVDGTKRVLRDEWPP